MMKLAWQLAHAQSMDPGLDLLKNALRVYDVCDSISMRRMIHFRP